MVVWSTAIALITLVLISLMLGRYRVPLNQLVRILASRSFPFIAIEKTWTAPMYAAVISIRLPRILAACMVGGCLGLAGSVYQGIFKNPLASPDILGAASGCGFGAALAILLGLGAMLVTAFAFIGGIFAVCLAFLFSRRAGGGGVMGLLLTGIVIGSLFTAGTSYIKLAADPTNQLPAITYWLMGGLAGTKMRGTLLASVPMLAGILPLLLLRFRLNLLSLGEDEARALGVHTTRLRAIAVLCATLITAASVAISGVIGWVGLVVPHICRLLAGSDNRKLFPLSILMGALLLLMCDNISRCLTVTELPLGIITAVVGAPFFLYVAIRRSGAYV